MMVVFVLARKALRSMITQAHWDAKCKR